MVCSYAEAWRDLGARAQLVPSGALVDPTGGARGAATTVLCVSLSLDPSGREVRGALRALEQAQPEWLIADWAPSGGASPPATRRPQGSVIQNARYLHALTFASVADGGVLLRARWGGGPVLSPVSCARGAD